MRRVQIFIIIILSLVWLHSINGVPLAEEFSVTLEGGTTQAHYQLISFPVKPECDHPECQDPLLNEEILIDELGPYNPYEWRLFRWDPTAYGGQGAHIELNQRQGDIVWTEDQNIDFGRGYWIISAQTKTANVSGIADDSNKTIILYPGWNQIGNPFYEMQSNLNVGPVGEDLVPLTDDLNVYTDKYVWEWVGEILDYQMTTDPLAVGKGYWIRNITVGLLELEFVSVLPSSGQVNSTPYDLSALDITGADEPPSPPSAIESYSSLSFSSGSVSGGCFIATAAYGNYDHPNVQLLRGFRDRYLLTNCFGRIFVDMYYRYSPALARFVSNSKPIKALVRFSLIPIIGFSTIIPKIEMHNFFIVFVFPLLGVFFLIKKGVWGKCRPKFSIKSKQGKRKM